jgi:hypothetical protein
MSLGRDGPVGTQMRPDCPCARGAVGRGLVDAAVGLTLAASLLIVGGRGVAGHSVGHFPSYYPDEIRVEALEPAAAGKALVDATLHAYVGAVPSFAGHVPGHVRTVSSLASLLVLSFDTSSPRFAASEDRCAAARELRAALVGADAPGFVFHPYPVTPHHADYLHHLDRVETARITVGRGAASPAPLTVGAKGPLAEAIVRARWGRAADNPDAILEEVPVDAPPDAASIHLDGGSGPPWLKEGWFHAYRALTPGLDPGRRKAVDDTHDRLVRGETRGQVERVDLERELVAALERGCGRVVAGYGLKQEYLNDSYPAGIENVAYDSLAGLNAPVFLRTVKLKEYPWNGKLRLAVPNPPDSAWNPVGGFTDGMGRLMWAAIGDPAMIAFPFNASWMPNRVQAEVTRIEGQSGGIRVPADALRPVPGSGVLQRVGERVFGSARVVYEVLASPFEDGTEMTMADILYPFAFAYRWDGSTGAGRDAHEPGLAAVSAALQERLVGIKVVRVEATTHAIAEGLTVVSKTPVVEVYLRSAQVDERQAAALAPPWSTVPWHLLALMEEAVIRGHAAFSQAGAARRGVRWLDLARDRDLRATLQDLIVGFERERFRPEALKDLVTSEEAQARWRSLRTFVERSGHFLVTNGPYRLKHWMPERVVLEAVREVTYPLGFGTFDRFVNPPRTVIETVTQEADAIVVRANAELTLKAGRDYRLVKEPLLRTTARGVHPLLVVSRYLLIGPDGKVLEADKMAWREDGQFSMSLPKMLPEGQYTVVLGIFLDGNSLLPSTKVLHIRVRADGSRG